ncbi:exonuclease domain-containing protein [Spirosoma migulaei]
MDFITIDFETATAQRDSPCEIGLSFVENSQIVETKSWLIKPHYYPHFDFFNVAIHGIRPQDVKNAPEFCDLWGEIRPMIDGRFLIAHNAGFDFSVLRKTLDTYKIPYPTLNYSCSYIFSKKVWLGLPAYDLKTLCRTNNIDLQHHRAAADSRATAELALKAFELSGVCCIDDFPDKLRTVVGRIYEGGYKPSETKQINRNPTQIVGDITKHNPKSIFYGRSVVFTGALSSMVRANAQQLIADIGGIIGDGVTAKTDFLIVGQQDYRVVGDDGMSSKQEKAIKLVAKGSTLEIISEIDFLRNL